MKEQVQENYINVSVVDILPFLKVLTFSYFRLKEKSRNDVQSFGFVLNINFRTLECLQTFLSSVAETEISC